METLVPGYVDVHTHLTHEQFAGDCDAVLTRARAAGLKAIVVNGLDPESNDQVMALANAWPEVQPAWGIYPTRAVWNLLPDDFPHPGTPFDVDAEIARIRAMAESGQLAAVGECGLDGYWADASTFARQEEVFAALVTIAKNADIPVIIHSRKMEARCFAMIEALAPPRVDFHCYGGKTQDALRVAEQHGWCFSIPANAERNGAFCKMLASLPPECILTETDASYLPPDKGARNEPTNVVRTVTLLARLRNISVEEARNLVWLNFLRLFWKDRSN